MATGTGLIIDVSHEYMLYLLAISECICHGVSVPPREECGAGQGPHHLFLDWWISQIWEVWAW